MVFILLVGRGEFWLDIPAAKHLPQPLDAYDTYRDASGMTHTVLAPAVSRGFAQLTNSLRSRRPNEIRNHLRCFHRDEM